MAQPMPCDLARFRARVRKFYGARGRDLPWRRTTDPYRILVSEIMLQQTQVERVAAKWTEFLAAFPDFEALAAAPLARVLGAWKGLGYNRRALALWKAAAIVVRDHGGALPDDPERLARLPGIGAPTAAAVCAYAFNAPVVYIETNIRTVFLHHFFPGRKGVPDAEILPLVARTLDRRNPRAWYSALMDLGTALKKTHGNPNRRSAHYRPQTPFEGSRRQLRGRVLAALVGGEARTAPALALTLGTDQATLAGILATLVKEGLLARDGRAYRIA